MTDSGPWSRILVRHPQDAFLSADKIAREWRDLHFTAPPDLARACEQFDAFVSLCAAHTSVTPIRGTHEGLTLDAIYVRDASIMSPRGAILCRMGKPQRHAEPAALSEMYRQLGINVIGEIQAPGKLEGGDFTWLGPRLAAVGRGYRTNDEGIRQLRALLGDTVDELLVVELPHHRGPGDVFHLMSIISPVDHDLAVVYSPLMPVSFRERLLERGFGLVEVPDEEFDSMGANVLAAAPRQCVMVEGNPQTRAALERAGADVRVYDGADISLMGGGGPTCLTRPVPMGAGHV
jgi:N-dimethylarginine dimethylaminohydrolase